MEDGVDVRGLVEGFWELWLFGRREMRMEWIVRRISNLLKETPILSCPSVAGLEEGICTKHDKRKVKVIFLSLPFFFPSYQTHPMRAMVCSY